MRTSLRSTLAVVLGASMLAAGCSGDVLGPQASADHASVFDEAWHQLDLHYSFFELKRINWDSLGAFYRPLALSAATDHEFASVLSRMLDELHDVHVSLTPTGSQGTMRYVSPSDTAPMYYSQAMVLHKYVPDAQTTSGGNVQFGMLAPTVGYIRIASFEGTGWESEVDDALSKLSGATRMVIDVRDNYGGKYTLAASIAGRFADRSHVYGYLRYRNGPKHTDFTDYSEETVTPSGPRQFTGPVYVLTNRRDFSSAEDFVLAMRALPSTTVVGDSTAGASGGPIVRDLPNGWTFQLSEWIEYTPTKATFEGKGLAPDVVVKESLNDWERASDMAVERALALAQR